MCDRGKRLRRRRRINSPRVAFFFLFAGYRWAAAAVTGGKRYTGRRQSEKHIPALTASYFSHHRKATAAGMLQGALYIGVLVADVMLLAQHAQHISMRPYDVFLFVTETDTNQRWLFFVFFFLFPLSILHGTDSAVRRRPAICFVF